jgi:Legume lectin domain
MQTGDRFRYIVGVVALLAASSAQAQSIDFSEFAADKGLTLNGAAKLASAGDRKVLRVTPAEETQAGSAFFTEKVALKDGFETTFTFQITEAQEPGADGFAFVIQNSSPRALGSPGSGLGYGVADAGEDAIARSLAVEFDTFSLKEAGAEGEDFGDPNGNHISVHSRGAEPNHVDESYSLGTVTEGLPSFKDGKPHKVKVSYTPGSLKIYVDSMEKPVQTLAIKLDAFSGKGFQNASVLDADGKAWVGFTAGTGGLWENHDILSWTLKPGAPGP